MPEEIPAVHATSDYPSKATSNACQAFRPTRKESVVRSFIPSGGAARGCVARDRRDRAVGANSFRR
jgi:hypothetical protein